MLSNMRAIPDYMHMRDSFLPACLLPVSESISIVCNKAIEVDEFLPEPCAENSTYPGLLPRC